MTWLGDAVEGLSTDRSWQTISAHADAFRHSGTAARMQFSEFLVSSMMGVNVSMGLIPVSVREVET
jgi:hypothetical protein